MSNPLKKFVGDAKLSISSWKVVKVLLLLWLGVKMTPEQLVAPLPDNIENLTVGVLLIGLLNYLKHTKLAEWIPLLKKIG